MKKAERYQKRRKSAEDIHDSSIERNQKQSKSAENIHVSDNQATSLIKEDVYCDGCGRPFSIGQPIKGGIHKLHEQGGGRGSLKNVHITL